MKLGEADFVDVAWQVEAHVANKKVAPRTVVKMRKSCSLAPDVLIANGMLNGDRAGTSQTRAAPDWLSLDGSMNGRDTGGIAKPRGARDMLALDDTGTTRPRGAPD